MERHLTRLEVLIKFNHRILTNEADSHFCHLNVYAKIINYMLQTNTIAEKRSIWWNGF